MIHIPQHFTLSRKELLGILALVIAAYGGYLDLRYQVTSTRAAITGVYSKQEIDVMREKHDVRDADQDRRLRRVERRLGIKDE